MSDTVALALISAAVTLLTPLVAALVSYLVAYRTAHHVIAQTKATAFVRVIRPDSDLPQSASSEPDNSIIT